MDKLASRSVSNEEFVLGVPFSVEEVATAVRKLKGRKAAGPDGLTAEHFKESGDVMVIWLVNILNAVVDMEVVPSTLKSLGTIKARPRSAGACIKPRPICGQPEVRSCLDSKSRENWPIAFAVRHPIPILAV